MVSLPHKRTFNYYRARLRLKHAQELLFLARCLGMPDVVLTAHENAVKQKLSELWNAQQWLANGGSHES